MISSVPTRAPETRCLLLLDLMVRLVDRFHDASLLANWVRARDAATTAGIPVIYVRIAFRRGYPEVALRNELFGPIVASGGLGEVDVASAIHPLVATGPDDIVVTKRRVSAVAGSDLEVILRGLGVETVVLAGLVTSGVVLSTLVEAVDRDFRVVVLRDGCADGDAVLHDALIGHYFPSRGRVLTTAEWESELQP